MVSRMYFDGTSDWVCSLYIHMQHISVVVPSLVSLMDLLCSSGQRANEISRIIAQKGITLMQDFHFKMFEIANMRLS